MTIQLNLVERPTLLYDDEDRSDSTTSRIYYHEPRDSYLEVTKFVQKIRWESATTVKSGSEEVEESRRGELDVPCIGLKELYDCYAEGQQSATRIPDPDGVVPSHSDSD